MPFNILLAGLGEHEDAAVEALQPYAHGMAAQPDIAAALAAVEYLPSDQVKTDLVVLGPMLPVATLMAIQDIKRHGMARDAAILVVNAKLAPHEAAAFLAGGADECYHQAPFLGPVFSARARGALRHKARAKEAAPLGEYVLKLATLSVDTQKRSASLQGAPITLARVEFELLAKLMGSVNQAVPQAELLKIIAKGRLYAGPKHLARELETLRAKLGRLGPLLETKPDGSASLHDPGAV